MGVAVLGPLTVDGDDAALGPRDRVVLAALAVRPGETLSAERLADALWGETPPTTWPKVVQGCIVRIRKVLGPDAVATSGHGYRLTVGADGVDAVRFQRLVGRGRELLAVGEPERAHYTLTQAAELWRGTPLPELEGWEPGEAAAARLIDLRHDADELRVESALEAGRWRDVLAEASALVADQPLRERRWGLLARAQYQAGRQGEALATIQRARAVLVSELGLDPGPELAWLAQAILRQDPALTPAAESATASAVCPYMGLRAYDVGETEAFFGRDREVAACRRILDAEGVVNVVGPSGSGKSSLIRAGVAAGLVRDGVRVAVLAPGDRPVEALAAVEGGRDTVLVVDQLEQCVTLCDDTAAQETFLRAVVAHHQAGGRLVLALRADHLGDLGWHHDVARLLERGLHLLGPMTADDLRAAIEGPARQAGLLLEGGLVDLLVREVEGEPGALPLLSHALAQTWERREGRTLTAAGYRDAGGIRGSVAKTAEDVFTGLATADQQALRDLLLRLTAPTPEGDPVRRRVPRRMVIGDDALAALVERLVAARLLTSDGDELELAHESLVRAWPRLRGWLDDDAGGQRILRHLAVTADTWDAMGRPDSELYRGVRLAQAAQWRQQTGPALTIAEQAFLDASEDLAAAEQQAAQRHAVEQAATNRRLRRQRVLLAAALVVALVVGVVAVERGVTANENAVAAQARAQAATAGVLAAADDVAETDWPLALLLATEARRIDDSALTRRGQLAALTAPGPVGMTLAESPDGYQALAVDTDAGIVAVNGPEGQMTVHDLDSGQEVAGPFQVPVFPFAGGVDVHGDLVAVGGLSEDGTGAIVYQIGEDEPAAAFGTPTEREAQVAFSPDGGRLAVSRPGTIDLVDTDTWTVQHTLVTGGDDPILSLAWSEDGTRVYAGSFPTIVAFAVPEADSTDPVTPSSSTEVPPVDDQAVIGLSAVPGADRIVATAFGGASYLLADDPLRIIEGPLLHDNITLDNAVSADGSLLAVAAFDSTVIWALDANPTGLPERVTSVATDSVNVAFTADGDLLTVGEDGALTRWQIDPASPVLTEAPELGPGVPTFSPDGSLLAMWGFGQGVRLYDSISLDLVSTLDVPDAETASLGGVAFYPDGDRVAVIACQAAIESRDYCPADLSVFDATSGDVVAGPVATPPISHWTPSVVAVSGDGGWLATGHAGGTVELYDPDTLQSVTVLDDIAGSPQAVHVLDIDFAADASMLTASTGLGTAVWDLDDDPPSLVQQGRVSLPVTFTPDGGLVTSTQGGVVAVRDPRTFDVQVQVGGLPTSLTDPKVSADGTLMVTTDDGTGHARVWTLPTLEQVAGPLDGPYYADIHPDGSVVVLGSTSTQLLTLDADVWDDAACRAAGRNLDDDEWARYFPDEPYRATCPNVSGSS